MLSSCSTRIPQAGRNFETPLDLHSQVRKILFLMIIELFMRTGPDKIRLTLETPTIATSLCKTDKHIPSMMGQGLCARFLLPGKTCRERKWESAERQNRHGEIDGVAIIGQVKSKGQPTQLILESQFRPSQGSYVIEVGPPTSLTSVLLPTECRKAHTKSQGQSSL